MGQSLSKSFHFFSNTTVQSEPFFETESYPKISTINILESNLNKEKGTVRGDKMEQEQSLTPGSEDGKCQKVSSSDAMVKGTDGNENVEGETLKHLRANQNQCGTDASGNIIIEACSTIRNSSPLAFQINSQFQQQENNNSMEQISAPSVANENTIYYGPNGQPPPLPPPPPQQVYPSHMHGYYPQPYGYGPEGNYFPPQYHHQFSYGHQYPPPGMGGPPPPPPTYYNPNQSYGGYGYGPRNDYNMNHTNHTTTGPNATVTSAGGLLYHHCSNRHCQNHQEQMDENRSKFRRPESAASRTSSNRTSVPTRQSSALSHGGGRNNGSISSESDDERDIDVGDVRNFNSPNVNRNPKMGESAANSQQEKGTQYYFNDLNQSQDKLKGLASHLIPELNQIDNNSSSNNSYTNVNLSQATTVPSTSTATTSLVPVLTESPEAVLIRGLILACNRPAPEAPVTVPTTTPDPNIPKTLPSFILHLIETYPQSGAIIFQVLSNHIRLHHQFANEIKPALLNGIQLLESIIGPELFRQFVNIFQKVIQKGVPDHNLNTNEWVRLRQACNRIFLLNGQNPIPILATEPFSKQNTTPDILRTLPYPMAAIEAARIALNNKEKAERQRIAKIIEGHLTSNKKKLYEFKTNYATYEIAKEHFGSDLGIEGEGQRYQQQSEAYHKMRQITLDIGEESIRIEFNKYFNVPEATAPPTSRNENKEDDDIQEQEVESSLESALVPFMSSVTSSCTLQSMSEGNGGLLMKIKLDKHDKVKKEEDVKSTKKPKKRKGCHGWSQPPTSPQSKRRRRGKDPPKTLTIQELNSMSILTPRTSALAALANIEKLRQTENLDEIEDEREEITPPTSAQKKKRGRPYAELRVNFNEISLTEEELAAQRKIQRKELFSDIVDEVAANSANEKQAVPQDIFVMAEITSEEEIVSSSSKDKEQAGGGGTKKRREKSPPIAKKATPLLSIDEELRMTYGRTPSPERKHKQF